MVKIGKKLREARLNCNLSIEKVIKKLEELNIYVTKKTIYRWENDDTVPDLKTINTLSFIYNANLNELYEDTKFCKSLNENEYRFIIAVRENEQFRKITKLLYKI
ncbi:MAG: helix-turn-helix transcriptional regulator [Lachnospiraceae bacterium]|nr:helix-turn-helix transcriptional regulator [Lachnospiraceae bacterium]